MFYNVPFLVKEDRGHRRKPVYSLDKGSLLLRRVAVARASLYEVVEERFPFFLFKKASDLCLSLE